MKEREKKSPFKANKLDSFHLFDDKRRKVTSYIIIQMDQSTKSQTKTIKKRIVENIH